MSLIGEMEVTTKQKTAMRQWIHGELEAAGYTRSHSFSDFYPACRLVVGRAAKKFCRNNVTYRFMWNMEATFIVMDYIDPWN